MRRFARRRRAHAVRRAMAVMAVAGAAVAGLPGSASAGSVALVTATVRTSSGATCTLYDAGSVNLAEWSENPLPWGQTVRWSSEIDCDAYSAISPVRTDSRMWTYDTTGLLWWETHEVSCQNWNSCAAVGRWDDAWRAGPMTFQVKARYSIRTGGDAWVAYPKGSYEDGFACEVDRFDARTLLCYAEAYGNY